MAFSLRRLASNIVSKQRPVLLCLARSSSAGGKPVDHHKGKVVSDVSMPDALGHAVGVERFELLAKLAGNEDPFEMNVKKRGKGTSGEPNLVPSLFDMRLIGCICEEESLVIHWMHLYKGEPKRCQCGYWFKLSEMKPIEY
ncbi:cytochrome c oxidase subunit 5B, mitochondrial-like [Octopus vulgaris]|uniref:Cytochrome c oxidase subunit 5B, mitochondrial-like n=1 Tax=Octopus vulgaris TaxID=6645 RepID=A0AA36B2E5_OCTVU|nr:cytochrome c oxidase subunit 5B, mitochondrial-like [Octopus vulgaris]